MDTPAQAVPIEVAAARLHRIRRVSWRAAAQVFGAFLLASAVCVGMVLIRRLWVGYASYKFFIWNLALAWIPLGFASFTYLLHVCGSRRRWLFGACAVAWFVFFPNAPYMVTDFVHISPIHIAPEWLDVITVAGCAWTGLCLGYLSLYLMQEIVRERAGAALSWLFALAMLGFGSVGVYCGRFLRWNSWDVLRNPLGMMHDAHVAHRFSQPRDALFIVTLFLFLLLSYGVLYALTHAYDRVERSAVLPPASAGAALVVPPMLPAAVPGELVSQESISPPQPSPTAPPAAS